MTRWLAVLYDRLPPAIGSFFLSVAIRIKWQLDKAETALEPVHWPMYRDMHLAYYFKNRTLPNLVSPKNLNDQINWLKLFDQDEQKTTLADKIKVKAFVRQQLGQALYPQTLGVYGRDDAIELTELPSQFVLKTNHDCGGVALIDQTAMTVEEIESEVQRLRERLDTPHPAFHGELHYRFIEPRLLAEEMLHTRDGNSPADWKFHCSDGRVLWVQYIYDRDTNPKQINLTPGGTELGLVTDGNKPLGHGFSMPGNWQDLLTIAAHLSQGMKYVRVDLYNENNEPKLGELTFTPGGGVFSLQPVIDEEGRDLCGQEYFGTLLQLDRSTSKHPVLSEKHAAANHSDSGAAKTAVPSTREKGGRFILRS